MQNLRTPRARRRQTDPMREYDALPPELRQWLASANLPWSPRSVRRLWQKALQTHGDRQRAIASLQKSESRAIARDARRVWGAAYPDPGFLRE